MGLIITGHPRSGTPLLQELCYQHPDIAMTNEFGSFTHIGLPYTRFAVGMLKRWYRVQGRWSFDRADIHKKHKHLSNLAFTTRFLLKIRKQHSLQVHVQTIDAAMKNLFPQAVVVGDKWPHYMFHLDQLAGISDLSLVVIYRDCRDVVSSFLIETRTDWRHQAWIKNMDTAEKIAKRWVGVIKLMEAKTDQLHMIRYEELVQEPEKVLNALGSWLNVDPAGFSMDNIRDTSLGKYKTGLSTSELATVIDIAGPTMAQYGYI